RLACQPKLARRSPHGLAKPGRSSRVFLASERRLAERVGFEPTVEFPLHTLSKRAPSTTRPSLRFRINNSWSRLKRNTANCVRPHMVARSLTSTQYSCRAMKHGASEFRAAYTTWNSTLTAAGGIPPALVRQQGSWGPRAPTTPKDLCRRFSPSRYRLKERGPSTAASAPQHPWDRRARCCDDRESAGTRRRQRWAVGPQDRLGRERRWDTNPRSVQ